MAPMPPAWLAVEDEESGAMYFYHERTGRTTWEHPADRCALHPLAQTHSLLSLRRARCAAPLTTEGSWPVPAAPRSTLFPDDSLAAL